MSAISKTFCERVGNAVHLACLKFWLEANVEHDDRVHMAAHIAIRLFEPIVKCLFAECRTEPMLYIDVHAAKESKKKFYPCVLQT